MADAGIRVDMYTGYYNFESKSPGLTAMFTCVREHMQRMTSYEKLGLLRAFMLSMVYILIQRIINVCLCQGLNYLERTASENESLRRKEQQKKTSSNSDVQRRKASNFTKVIFEEASSREETAAEKVHAGQPISPIPTAQVPYILTQARRRHGKKKTSSKFPSRAKDLSKMLLGAKKMGR
ncbi:hypothetical protein AAMO2058_000701900 [Amorphochlora amoebiformis]